MNYQNCYDKIINNAKTRVNSSDIYREKHHIVPRSLGGTDTSDNIVSLTGKEHYIVHHLLYKIYENNKSAGANKKMMMAWFCMANINGSSASNHKDRYTINANQYSRLRSHYSRLMTDCTVYTFVHKSKIIFTGTRRELISYTMNSEYPYSPVTRVVVSAIVNGKVGTEWCLLDMVHNGFYWDCFTVSNGTTEITGFASDLKSIGLTLTDINRLKNKAAHSVKGYKIISINGVEFFGKDKRIYHTAHQVPGYKTDICTWEHSVYGIEICTMGELTIKYNLVRSAVSSVFYGKAKSHFGWEIRRKNGALFSYKKTPGVTNTKSGRTRFESEYLKRVWYHPKHGTVTLTVNELTKQYNLPRSQIHDLVEAVQKSCYGWVYLGIP